MKKSKIIIPAVAVLTLSVAAGITGTVAWFSATQSVTFSGSNVAVVNTEGNLGLSFSNPSSGATVNGTTVTLPHMRPASYDIFNSKLFTIVDESATTKAYRLVNFTDSVSVNINSTATNVYYGATVEGKFTVQGTNDDSYFLIFDASKTSSYLKQATEGNPAALKVFESFRVGMTSTKTEAGQGGNPKAVTQSVVWAPLTKENTPAYISSETETTNYDLGEETRNMIKGEDSTKYDLGSSKATVTKNALTLATDLKAGATGKTVQFSFWFEGTDDACVTASEGITNLTSTVAAHAITMGFYALNQANMKTE